MTRTTSMTTKDPMICPHTFRPQCWAALLQSPSGMAGWHLACGRAFIYASIVIMAVSVVWLLLPGVNRHLVKTLFRNFGKVFMKKLLILVLIGISSHALAQDSLKTFNYSRNRITTTGMEVLGSWAIANIGVGSVGLANSEGGA